VIISLPRKFAVFFLLVLCAPLYVLLRFFYGKAFAKMLSGALAIHLLALAFLRDVLAEYSPTAEVAQLYDSAYGWGLAELAIYTLPLHLLWFLFYWFSQDGRYDVDQPGHPPLPVHPWLLEIPIAMALPVVVATIGAIPVTLAVPVPSWLRFTLPDIIVSTHWWFAATVTSVAYIGVALLTTEPPRIRFRRTLKVATKKVPFDVARIAVRPYRGTMDREAIINARPEALRRLAGERPAPPD